MNLVKLAGMTVEYEAAPEEDMPRKTPQPRMQDAVQVEDESVQIELPPEKPADELFQEVTSNGEDAEIYASDEDIPEIPDTYMVTPDTKVIRSDTENPSIGRNEGPSETSVSEITPEQFERDRLSLTQGRDEVNDLSWIERPDVWPPFVEFPSRKDRDAIAALEKADKLTDEKKKKFNEQFQRHSELMQIRAWQLDHWIQEENEKFNDKESSRAKPWDNQVKKNLRALQKTREDLRASSDLSSGDAFKDIKWAVLLDPHASPQDQRFADVSRWGHSSLETYDGGQLCATDDELYVPRGYKATKQVAKQMVLEALERGWTHLDVNGSIPFCEAVKEECRKVGMGAKFSYGRHGVSFKASEFLMPNPPALNEARTMSAQAKVAHDELMSDEGRLPKGDAPTEKPRNSEAHGEKKAETPFREDLEEDEEEPAMASPEA